MSIVVFTGPTISQAQAANYLNATYLPPAQQGDVYLACLDAPQAIVIIDGYFERVPAIWHKEILYAMARGIHVYGCSSMGALRAAELDVFGMEGFGQVYHDFKQGKLEDDDEVALVHAPKELGHQGISEPMVNIRATLETAQQSGLLSELERHTLIDKLKLLWYPKRSYAQLLTQAALILDEQKLQQLTAHVKTASVNIKQRDAIALLNHLAKNIDFGSLAPKKVEYTFTPTDAWDMLVRDIDSKQFNQKLSINFDDLINQLKLKAQYVPLKEQALTRQSALREVKKHRALIPQQLKQQALIDLSKRQHCINENQVDFDKLGQWLDAQSMSLDDFDALVDKQAALGWIESIENNVEQEIVELLKLNGDFNHYQKKLNSRTNDLVKPNATVESLGLTQTQLWQWFFDCYFNQGVPADINAYAYFSGFNGLDEFKRSVLIEYQHGLV